MTCVGNRRYGTLPDVELTVVLVAWTSTPEEQRGAWARVYVAVDGNHYDGIVLVATRREAGRQSRRIVDVVVGGDDAARVAAILPWSRIEFFLQGLPELASELTPDDDGATALSVAEDPLGAAILEEWTRMEGLTAAAMVPSGVLVPGERTPLTRPTGVNTEEFYQRVGAAYSEVFAKTRAVAPVLAEEAGVPVRTVHGWIREARRRGHLPPSDRGTR